MAAVPSSVRPAWPADASRETTFTRDVSDPVELDGHLVRLATEVTESVVAEGRTVTHVAVKVRTASFYTRTKISKLPAPTTDPAEVAARRGSSSDGSS